MGDSEELMLAVGAVAYAVALLVRYTSGHDFTRFYDSGLAWRHGAPLYDSVNLNSPLITALLFVPLTHLSYTSAFALWRALNLLCMLVAWRFLTPSMSGSMTHQVALLALWLSAVPSILEFEEGQIGGILMLIGAIGWWALQRQRWVVVAIAVAALVLVKPIFVWLILAIPFWRHRCWTVGLIIAVTAIAMGIQGLRPWLDWIVVLREYSGRMQEIRVNASLHVLFHGWLGWTVSLLAVIATWRLARTRERRWWLWGLVSILVSPVGWVYYLLPLAGPAIAWLNELPMVAAILIATAFFLHPFWMPAGWYAAAVATIFATSLFERTGRMKASASQAGAACVPSGRSSIATREL